jgi:predicted transporter
LRHSQNLAIGAIRILAAFVIGFGVYTLQRIDQTQDAIAREAAAMRQELIGVTTAIANSITAARQMQPQILVVPSGGQAPPAPPKPLK